jgi:hypothetical protein
MIEPTNKDKYRCPNCGEEVSHRSPYMYAKCSILPNKRIQIIDHWNIPYSTGIYILAEDTVTKEEVEKFASSRVHFPFWPVVRHGILWSKETWDD